MVRLKMRSCRMLGTVPGMGEALSRTFKLLLFSVMIVRKRKKEGEEGRRRRERKQRGLRGRREGERDGPCPGAPSRTS